MTDSLLTAVDLPLHAFWLISLTVFAAGVVRGFSGFGLSALVMASVATLLPPIELIPVCWALEAAAGLLMARAGIRDADWSVVVGLAVGSAVGVPIGLAVTGTLATGTSSLVALSLILGLAILSLARVRPLVLGHRCGSYGAGVLAGIATGLASVGGMVVALYVLARDAPPARMRASLVMFLVISTVTTGLWLLGAGMLDRRAAMRGLMLVPIVTLGVFVGTALFRPRWQRYYRPICLLLLMGLAVAGLVRLAIDEQTLPSRFDTAESTVHRTEHAIAAAGDGVAMQRDRLGTSGTGDRVPAVATARIPPQETGCSRRRDCA